MIILVGSNKGGAGKTTTAITLASGLAQNYDVCLLDADTQPSAAVWANDRESSEYDLKHITCLQKYGNLQPTLSSLKNKYEHIIIDVAGRNSREFITGMLCSDILISPAQCSQLDLDTLKELQEQVNRSRDFNPNLKVFIYHVMMSTNPKVAPANKQEFIEFVSEYKEFKCLDSISCYRKIYRDTIPLGKSVFEQDHDVKAKNEAESLIKEVLSHGN